MPLSELPESKSAQPTLPRVAPLALSTVKHRYPRIFREYASLVERQMGSGEALESPIDSATGLRTTIFFVDFAAPLSTEGDAAGVPMKADSDANRFSIFVWKCLSACESGSVSGDACRQFGMLNAALDDAVALASTKDSFSHLLGWTCAAFNHGMDSMMYRYCPHGICSLFLAAAAEWKKKFEVISEGGCFAWEVSAYLRGFAIWNCEALQKMLKSYKKEMKDQSRESPSRSTSSGNRARRRRHPPRRCNPWQLYRSWQQPRQP
jgi:hypothetical protein